MLKKIARKILKNEIEELKDRYNQRDKEHWDTIQENTDKILSMQKEINTLNEVKQKLTEEKDDMEMRIAIMSQYYDLNREPTDEEKMKIRLDLKVHELEMQNLRDRMDMLNCVSKYFWTPASSCMPSYYPWIR